MQEDKAMDVMDRIDSAVKDNPVVIFMKGSPQIPQCGYSSRAAQALAACGEEFAHVNWPTFPQIYINGELIGGCDITMELYQKGELQKMVKQAVSGA
jgi:monothiol glutaredoxin